MKIERITATWRDKTFVKTLLRQQPQAEVFLVGGMVRDALLGREVKDADLVVRGVPKKQLEAFLQKHGAVNLVGKRFGVFKFVPKNSPRRAGKAGWRGGDIDIALPRTEHSLHKSGVYKDFKIKSNAKLKIEDDLSRRDFTINAMAFKIARGAGRGTRNYLIDPLGGYQDLKNKIIRTVGKPQDRFQEDYSRMLRAIRFSCQLDFKIEPRTWQALKKEMPKLTKTVQGAAVVPFEVIAHELNKAVVADPVCALTLLDQSNALKILMPEILKMKGCPQPRQWHSEGDVWQHTLLALKNLGSKKFKAEFRNQTVPTEIIWGLIFHDLGKPYTIKRGTKLTFYGHDAVSAKLWKDIAQRLRLSSAGVDAEAVEKIIAKHMLPATAKGSAMKHTTIEKYFYRDTFPGRELLMLIWTDISATVPPSGRPDFTEYRIIKRQITRLRGKTRATPPKPLIDGHDIMKKWKLTPGPRIGQLLEELREAQLSGKVHTKSQAFAHLKKHL